MFGLFKKRPKVSTEHSVGAIENAVAAFGALLSRYPAHVIDTSALPASKEQMKTYLKAAWKLSRPEQRDTIELGFLHLADFQNGVGSRPICLALSSAELTPHDVISALASANIWMQTTSAEMRALRAEFDEFKRTVV
jgi:hypothetical protein